MFEVRCIVGDKKLHDVLRALKGQTLEHPVVIPVDDNQQTTEMAETEVTQQLVVGKLPQVRTIPQKKKRRKFVPDPNRKPAVAIVSDYIEAQRLSHINAATMRAIVEQEGHSRNSYSHAIKLLTKRGVLKATDFGEYDVVLLKAPGHSAGEVLASPFVVS